MTVAEQIHAVRSLIADEKHWTRGTWARTADGYEIENPDHPDAACWCLGGAIARVTADDGIVVSEHPWGPARPVWSLIEEVAATDNLIAWNDSAVHRDVLAILDEAIEVATASTRNEGSDAAA